MELGTSFENLDTKIQMKEVFLFLSVVLGAPDPLRAQRGFVGDTCTVCPDLKWRAESSSLRTSADDKHICLKMSYSFKSISVKVNKGLLKIYIFGDCHFLWSTWKGSCFSFNADVAWTSTCTPTNVTSKQLARHRDVCYYCYWRFALPWQHNLFGKVVAER